jgi:DNA-binding transcriptional MerR regulator
MNDVSGTVGEGVRPRGKSAAAFRTISEVATALDVPQHVLRFWETRFSQIKPLKRGGGRRYYRPEDVALLQEIRRLLYNEGYTIKGVQRLLREGGALKTVRGASVSAVATAENAAPGQSAAKAALPDAAQIAIRAAIAELESVRDALGGKGK